MDAERWKRVDDLLQSALQMPAAQSHSLGYFVATVELDGETHIQYGRGRNEWIGAAIPSPDGHHLAISQRTFETNAWLLENF